MSSCDLIYKFYTGNVRHRGTARENSGVGIFQDFLFTRWEKYFLYTVENVILPFFCTYRVLLYVVMTILSGFY